MRRRLAVFASLLAVAVAAFFLGRDGRDRVPTKRALEAETLVVERTDLIVRSELEGEVSYGDARAVASRRAGTVTEVARAGARVDPGAVLYRVDEQPIVVLDGDRPAYRTFAAGMSDGADVHELEAALRSLGHDPGSVDERFTSSTAAAIRSLQRSVDAPDDDGRLELGDVVFALGGARVVSVMAAPGSIAAPGSPVVTITGGNAEVTFGIEPADAGSISADDAVQVRVGDDDPLSGTVTSVAAVATTPVSSSGVPGDPEVRVRVQLPPGTTGLVDGQPVTVAVETDRVVGVLAVPVRALLALSEGGYALEVAEGDSTRLAAIELGRFVDAMVEIRPVDGSIEVGDRVVLPSR